MILMRDSFVDGLFGGMERMNRIRHQWNELDDKRAQVDAAEMAREQMGREDQQPTYQPVDQRVDVGPQQPRGAVRMQPVDLTPPVPAGPSDRPERRGEIDNYRTPSAMAGLPQDQPPPGAVVPRRPDVAQGRPVTEPWDLPPRPAMPSALAATPTNPAAGGPPPGPADGYDYGGDVPGQTPGRRPWWDWAGRAQDRYSPSYAREPAAPEAPPARPAPGDLSSWSARARANYPPQGAPAGPPPAARALAPNEQPTGAPDLSSWSERARTRYPSGMGAPPPAQPQPGQQGADAAPTVGSRVLSVLSRLNPIGSAQAATPARGLVGAPQPQEAPQPAPTQAAQPQAAVVSQAPPVAPQQAGPTAVSGPPPAYVRPPFNDQPYAFLARQAPQDRVLVDRVAQEEGVTPSRLALHWWLESGLRHQAPDGAAGERGPLQILPGTQRMVDPAGKLDPNKVEDALRLAARYIYRNDAIFGADTASSIVAYQGGPGTAMRFSQDPQAAIRSNPNGAAYLSRAFPGSQQWSREHFPPAIDVDPDMLTRVAAQGGPQEFVQLIARSSPGRSIDDGWRAAEAAMVYAALRRGDYQGAQNAREMVLQMSQQGATQSLQQAHQMLATGNAQGAATALARAHAFVPDGQAGQFGVDKAGNLWGRMVDDRDPNKPMGDFFRVTPQDIQRLMVQTRDPNKYVELIQKQQDHAAKIRLSDAHAKYYEGADDRQAMVTGARQAVAEERQRGALEVARLNADSREQIAQLRQQVDGKREQHTADVMREIGVGDAGIYASERDPMRRAALETIHADLRINNNRIAPGAAKAYAEGVLNGKIHLVPGQNGTYGLVDSASGTTVGVLSPQAAQRILPSLRQAAPPPRPGSPYPPALPRALTE